MTGLTLVVGVLVLLAATGRISYVTALAVGGATPSGAALVVGTTVVPTFYAVALAVAAALALAVLRPTAGGRRERVPLPPGGLLLLAFLGWSVLITLVAPLAFDGQVLVHPTSYQLRAGVLTSSNLAQTAYLTLSICVVLYLARSTSTGPGVLGLALGLSLSLSFLRYLSLQTGLPFPEGFFDSSPTFTYIETEAGGGERFRGIQSEPAALASTCVVGMAYFLTRAAQVQGPRRVGCLAIVGAAAYMGVVSTSATFVVAGGATGALVLLIGGTRFIARRATMGVALGLLVCGGIVLAAVWAPMVLDFLQTTVDDKVGSDSYADRSSADSLSYAVLLDTYGLGVGLGSARASSMIPTLLAGVGVVGVVLLLAAVGTLVAAARHDRACHPVLFAMLALVVVQVVSSPDLTGPSGTLWLALGVLARSASRTATPSVSSDAPGEPWPQRPGRGRRART